MHRIDGAAAAPGNLFTEGDPALGTPATVVTDDWLNAVQEEIATVIVTGGGIALSKPSNAQLLAALRVMISAALPPGAVQAFALSAAPAGWLECNGSTASRAAFPALFSAIGVTFGAGDGSTTFGLPDLRGEFIRGWDHGREVDPARALGTAQADGIKTHTHPIELSGVDVGGARAADSSGSVTFTSTTLTNTAPSGADETRPRNVAMMYCIRT